jgi:type VI secretion system secreted protein Hcp
MALPGYLRIVATTQGLIRGSVTQKGREEKILVLSSSHEIVSPRNPLNGRPTGKRMHKPFIIRKEVDRSSPLLYQILCTNENIAEWQLQLYRPDRTGIERNHYTVKLTNATISAIQFRKPDIRKSDPRLVEFEEVWFTYQKIEWIWVEGNITADDDWEVARQ